MSDRQKAQAVKERHQSRLLSFPNVTGLFTGEKETGGRKTGQTAIVVTVDQKRDVPLEDRIPATIEGIPTDVIEERVGPTIDKTRYDPLMGGASIAPCLTNKVGTLGCIVRDLGNGQPLILSNYHVLYADGNAVSGDSVSQPGVGDGGSCPADIVGELYRGQLAGSVDAAVATVSGRTTSGMILDIGLPAGQGVAKVGAAVRKRGRTSGITYGKITAVDVTVNIHYDDPIGTITLTNLIRVEVSNGDAFQLGGDSGSVLVNEQDEVVGLMFGANTNGDGSIIGTIGFASPIADVLDAMNAVLATDMGAATPPSGVVAVDEGTLTLAFAEGVQFNRLVTETQLESWELFGSFTFLTDTSWLRIGAGDPTKIGDDKFVMTADFGAPGYVISNPTAFTLSVPGVFDNGEGAPFAVGTPVQFRMGWDKTKQIFSCTACQDLSGDITRSIENIWFGISGGLCPVMWIGTDEKGTPAMKINEIRASRDCGDVVVGGIGDGSCNGWVDLHFGTDMSCSEADDGSQLMSLDAQTSTSAGYSVAGYPIDAAGFTMTGWMYYEAGGSDWGEPMIGILSAEDGNWWNYQYAFQIVGCIGGCEPDDLHGQELWLYSGWGGYTVIEDDPNIPPPNREISFTIVFDPAISTITLDWTAPASAPDPEISGHVENAECDTPPAGLNYAAYVQSTYKLVEFWGLEVNGEPVGTP